MSSPIASIVEGHGEVYSLPIVIRRIALELDPPFVPDLIQPLRIPASKLAQNGELENAVELSARKTGASGAILVLLDCDDGCPAKEGPLLLNRAQSGRSDMLVSAVLAKCEFEAWFLAAAVSLRGYRGLPNDLEPPAAPESIRAAKGWLDSHMPQNRCYSETVDQPAFSAVFDFEAAIQGSDSFNKFHREVSRLLIEIRDQ